MDFHGRWEKICSDPLAIADIGHNAHGLKYNFAQLEHYIADGVCTDLIIIYGVAADKDVESIFPLMPSEAEYIFTNAAGSRALPADILLERYEKFRADTGSGPASARSSGSVSEAVAMAMSRADEIRRMNPDAKPLVYIGGSTFVVSEALPK